jgi:3-dehydroquinate synthase
MTEVRVPLSARSYSVVIGHGLIPAAGPRIRSILPGSNTSAIVTDSTVGPLYASAVADSLRAAGFAPEVTTVPAGEPSKSIACAETVCRRMIRAGLDRSGFLVALGGGVIGDLAGFCAAIFFRGIPYVQMPTTVVSLVDSSVGGKTGVNTPEGKNLLGCFHQPCLVLADVATLETLPPREFNEGFAEIIKHAAIRDPAMFELIERAQADRSVLEDLVSRNVAIKAAIVSADEFESTGERALLNFGHTIGHAIEASAGYGSLLHGEAISLGLIAALNLSVQLAGLPPVAKDRIIGLLEQFHLPQRLPHTIDTATVMGKLSRDKKFKSGQIRFVLLRAPGDAFVSDDVTLPHIETAVEALRA